MKQLFKYRLLGFLLLILTIANCKAKEFNIGWWYRNEYIQGAWEDNAYYKLAIYQTYQKNSWWGWNTKLLYYSKYAYACNNDEKGNEFIVIKFLNEEDYNKTKEAWQKELPDSILKRMVFIDKYLSLRFLKYDDDCFKKGENDQNISFCKIGNVSLEEEKQEYPDSVELSR